MAEEDRATVKSLWLDNTASKGSLRKQLRAWERQEGGVGRVAARALDEVLLSEVFEQRVWRMTAKVALPELHEVLAWSRDDAANFVHEVAHAGECGAAARNKMQKLSPQLFEKEDSQQWLEAMIMPYRAAVLSKFARRLLQLAAAEAKTATGAAAAAAPQQQAKGTQKGGRKAQAGKDKWRSAPDVAKKSPEWRHELASLGGSSCVEIAQLNSLHDLFEEAEMNLFPGSCGAAPAVDAKALSALLGKIDAVAEGAPAAATIASYLKGHVGAACGGGQNKACGGSHSASDARFVPAEIARAAGSAAPPRRSGWLRGAQRPQGAAAAAAAEEAQGALSAVLRREDGLCYPVAALLLARLEAAGGRLAQASKRYQQFLGMVADAEAAQEDEPSCGTLPWAPYVRSRTVRYPFAAVSLDEALAEAEAAVAAAKAVKDAAARPSKVGGGGGLRLGSRLRGAREWLAAQPAVVLAYLALGGVIVVLVALNAWKKAYLASSATSAEL